MLRFSRMSFWKKTASFLVSLLFLWLALRNVEWAKIPGILKTARLEFVVLLFFSMSSEYLIRGLRWRYILGKPDLPYFYFLSGWVFGALGNTLFPARAGEFIRSFYLGRKNLVRTSEAFGSIVLERFLDGIVVVSFIAGSFSLFPVNAALKSAGYSAATFYFIVLVFILLMQFKKSWFDMILGWLVRPLPESWGNKIQSVQNSFVSGFSLVKQPDRLIISILGSYVTWCNSLLSTWIGFHIFSIPFGFSEALLLVAILSIGAMIPSSPGMIGIYEYCFVLALSGVLHTDHELAVTFGIFSHCFSVGFVVLLGGGLLFFENLSLKELQEKAEGADQAG